MTNVYATRHIRNVLKVIYLSQFLWNLASGLKYCIS